MDWKIFWKEIGKTLKFKTSFFLNFSLRTLSHLQNLLKIFWISYAWLFFSFPKYMILEIFVHHYSIKRYFRRLWWKPNSNQSNSQCLFLNKYFFSFRRKVRPPLLTCKIFICANTWVPPRVITPVSNSPVFPHPNQSVGTIVELFGIVRTAFPISVAVLDISHNTRLRETRVCLLNHPFVLSVGG